MATANETIINVQEIEPKLRHLTIFQVFDNLQPGESLVIHNNHDPKPVFYQLQDIRGDVFTWQYLQSGPEWWDIRVTKKEGAPQPAISVNMQNEIVITVPALEPKVKHETIFFTFANLQPGESMIIHNDHDPKPVYYQLQSMHGDIFTWDYLEQGPEWWDIRVTKKEVEQPNPYLNKNGDLVIDVPALEPSEKHSTIFHTFGNLEAGKTLIVHNDHDPKPLYHHLQSTHGDTFTWDYLQEGPQWWDVKISKKVVEQTEEEWKAYLKEGTNPAGKKEITLTIPMIEPKLKHPTIFNVFDSLEEGESLVIHNDHDPKPVYYQLLGERGDVFKWEYLEQGPQWWDIRVSRKGLEDSETIGEITAKDWRKAEIFKKYGIDFCCGGKKTVREACAEKGIDATKIEHELQQSAKDSAKGGYTNYDEWGLDFLADYVVNTHHNYVRKYMPEIRMYADKVAKVHGDNHPELIPIKELTEVVANELMDHMVEEETVLFPMVKRIFNAKNNNTVYTPNGERTLAEVVDKMEEEHDAVGRAMEKIREFSQDYTLPEDACASYTLLFKMLDEFESDLFTHIHLENNILFAKAAEMEKTL
ncbi:MAG TPA: iron-sulfur cluster repair di-iron protein [Edaphocola sp.]|nr:iron-sulfur cluster repair di-iron protein [Edaphocola sp.]